MKRTAILIGALVFSFGLQAQNQKHRTQQNFKPEPYRPDVASLKKQKNQHQSLSESTTATTFWSEDFSNGIPAGWSQNGSTATTLWEYRGPNTTPSTSTGSRGAFAQGTGVINSSTRNNGFVIFDSDYLDNGGSSTNMGGGTSPTPHVGKLTTDSIDLSTQTAVELSFTSYARQFFSNYYVVFSSDGGTTWTDTIELFEEVDVNASTDDDVIQSFNVSNYIGGSANAMMQFVFAGNKPGNTNGTGYYFWQLDDIELRALPEHEIRFTDIGNAPAQDISFNNDPAYSKYGVMNDDQIVPILFDANVYNYGSATQTNVRLEVEIFDGNDNLVTTVVSPAGASLNMLDSLDFNTLTTGTWTPSGPDSYNLVYKITSDTLSSTTTTTTDTVAFFVTEGVYGLDWNSSDNFFGTTSAVGDMIAAGARYSLENEDGDSAGSGLVFIDGVDVFLSLRCDTTADLEFQIFDTAGFVFNSGFPSGTNPLYTTTYNLSNVNLGGIVRFPFTTTDSVYDNSSQTWTEIEVPLSLPTGTYFVIINFFPNATDGVIRIANSTRYFQPIYSAVFQTGNGDWFGGFTGSQNFEAPIIRLAIADAPPFNVSLEEDDLNQFLVYPNPTKDLGYIQFERGGGYEVSIIDMVGALHHSSSFRVNENERRSLDLSSLKPGMYLVKIQGEGLSKTVKLQIQ